MSTPAKLQAGAHQFSRPFGLVADSPRRAGEQASQTKPDAWWQAVSERAEGGAQGRGMLVEGGQGPRAPAPFLCTSACDRRGRGQRRWNDALHAPAQ
jgi:hypothetical protein